MWRIDTIDPRAGLSFTSWREDTLFREEFLEDAPVFFIGAPSFTPVAVANRSVAMAAERRGFQLGLLDIDGEVGFATLEEVAEFVRRVYLSNSRGDTPEAGSLPVPPSPEGGPAPEALVTPKESILSEAVSDFDRMSGTMKRGKSRTFDWKIALATPSGGQSLAYGAEILTAELLYRFPEKVEKFETWRASAVRLSSIVERLGLLAVLSEKSIGNHCRRFLSEKWSKKEPFPVKDPESYRYPVVETFRVMAHQTIRYPWHFPAGARQAIATDPMDELSALPLPKRLVAALNLPPDAEASAATALSAILGSPKLLQKSPELEAILIFSACRIVAFEGSPHISTSPAMWATHGRVQANDGARIRNLLEAAQMWLKENLPAFAYHRYVEDMINSVSPSPYHSPGNAVSGAKEDGQSYSAATP